MIKDDAKDTSSDEEDSGNESNSNDEQKDNDWKTDLAQKASEAFYQRQSGTKSLRKIVYGKEELEEDDDLNGNDDDDDEIGGLFKIVSNEQTRKSKMTSGIDEIDCTKFAWSNLHDWNKDDIRDMIR